MGAKYIYTRDDMEAAMCMWEYVLMRLEEKGSEWETDIGMAQLRSNVLDAAPACDAAYMAYVAAGNEGDCFDWDFVPTWMNEHADEILAGEYSGEPARLFADCTCDGVNECAACIRRRTRKEVSQ